MTLLSLSGVCFSVAGRDILRGVDLQVEEGQILGIIGPNGSGKTTLLNALSGFALPAAGCISLAGTDITRMPPAQRARLGIGRVFQNFGIFKDMTLQDNILLALEERHRVGFWHSLPWARTHRNMRAEAMGFLRDVHLEAKAGERAGSLSGGQMRLLEIIRTLALGSHVILLDEPTAGVSPKMKGEVMHLLRQLQAMGKTIIIVEHDIHFISSLCSTVAVVDQGQVVMQGDPETVRQSPQIREIYFGTS